MMSNVHIDDAGRTDEREATIKFLVRDICGAGGSVFSVVMYYVAPGDSVAV